MEWPPPDVPPTLAAGALHPGIKLFDTDYLASMLHVSTHGVPLTIQFLLLFSSNAVSSG